MRSTIQFAIKNKLAIWLLTIMVVAAGLYAGFNMKMETIPSINPPVLSVTTAFPGAAPEEIDEEITEPLEKQIQNLPGVDVVTSTSSANVSMIQVEYSDYDLDMDQAKQEMQETIDKLTLPEGVEAPSINQLQIDAFPVITLSASGKGKTLDQLTPMIEEDLVPHLEGIEGVNSVQLSGQQTEEIQLTYLEEELKKHGLDQETVSQYIQGANLSAPLGLFTIEGKTQSVVVDGQLTTLEELKNLEIPVTPSAAGPGGVSSQSGQASSVPPSPSAKLPVVKLGEIAELKLVKESESISRTNGSPSIGVQVVKSSEANTVEIVEAVKKQAKEFEEKHDGTSVLTIQDMGKPIQDSVNTMLEKALLGALFAVIIILLFLRNIRSTLIAVLSIPLSLLIAVMVLHQMEITLNIMTLGAMTVAIGRVIDDSIVVIENIYRRMTLAGEKLKGWELIREATREMFIPILSSTIVTVAVFLPLALVTGPVGEMFFPFAMTIVCSLLASLLVAVTLVPMMAHSLFKNGIKTKPKTKDTKNKEKPKKQAGRLAHAYQGVLSWSLDHKWISFGLAVVLLIASFFLVPLIGVSFLPSEQEKMLIVTYDPEPGATTEDVEELALKAESFFLDKKQVETLQYSVGGENPINPTATNQALFYVKYKDDTANFDQVKEQVKQQLQEKVPGQGEWGTMDLQSGGASNSISLYVYGNTMQEIQPVVEQVQAEVEENQDLVDVDSSLSESYHQYALVTNQEKLSQLGLSAGQIAQALAGTGEESALTTIKKDGEELSVYVQKDQTSYDKIENFTEQTITSPLGIEVPISDVVEVKEEKAADQLSKRNGKFYAEVSATVQSDNVAEVSTQLQQEIDKLKIPSTVSVEFGGVTQQIEESFTQLGLAMLAAVGIVYFILVLTFSGGLAPLAILFSLPFAIIGGLVGLYLAGETISVSALIGALMLIGIVVTNAIVLIDRVIHKEQEGLSTRDALIEAGMTRLRPILMTAIATVGALLPLAVGGEGGVLISKGLGVTVIGGLTSSTLLTLIIVPIVYEILMKMRRGKKTKEIQSVDKA